jgi:hypothetical protein
MPASQRRQRPPGPGSESPARLASATRVPPFAVTSAMKAAGPDSALPVNPYTDDDMRTESPPKSLRVLCAWPDRVACVRAYTPQFVAERAGVSLSTIYAYRSGARTVPLDVLAAVAAGAGVEVDIVEAAGWVMMVEAVAEGSMGSAQ